MVKFTNSAGQPITLWQAVFAFVVQLAVGFLFLMVLYCFTVLAFCL
jgi:hypothetical protein